MIRHERPAQILAVALSALAGFVDACGYIALGGFFVSFMSGNSTRLGLGLAHDMPAALEAGSLIGTFLVGVMLGSVAGHVARGRRRPAVLALVSALLVAAAGLGAAQRPWLSALALALAMGAENAVFERGGEVQIGLTYMTGTLVKFGQRLVGALLGGPRLAWLPYLLLWLGLAGGAVSGAVAYLHFGPNALWVAAAAAMALTVVTAGMAPVDDDRAD